MADPAAKPFDSFPSTRWSLVARVAHADVKVQRAALAELLPRYMPAIRSYLISVRRLNEADADDLMQGFLTSKVLEDELIQRASQEKGKFRAFLITAINRYHISQIRLKNALKRGPGGQASLDDVPETASHQMTPPREFDVAWGRQVLFEAVGHMRADCVASNRMDVWGVFESRVLGDLFEGAEVLSYDELVQRYNLKSPVHASNILITGKRMFSRHLRCIIAEYEPDEALIDEEISALRAIFGGYAR